MDAPNYIYYAFISHSHKDAKWARWIQKALERYRLPSAIRKKSQKPLPKKLVPIFRDETDLGAGKLLENIHRELATSRHLIVICSPDSAVPNEEGKHWVNEEVRYFADELGRVDEIIPVLVRGAPANAFCPKLKELDPLAIDATKIKRRRVLNDVVAKLLGLRPDELWRRERRRWLIKMAVMGIFSALTLILVSIVSFVGWDRLGTHKAYFGDYVNDYELPRGIFQLSSEDVLLRNRHYEFCYRGYRLDESGHRVRALRSVKLCNFAGIVMGLPFKDWRYATDRPIWQDFEYREDGRLREKIVRDDSGTEIYRYSYPKEDVIEIIERESITPQGAFSTCMNLPGEGANVLYDAIIPQCRWLSDFAAGFRLISNRRKLYIAERNPEGIPARVYFFANDGSSSPCVDERGASGESFSFDNMGRVVRKMLMDDKGRALTHTNSVVSVIVDYDSAGGFNLIVMDTNEKQCVNSFGWSCCTYLCDNNLNITNFVYKNPDGGRVCGPDGYSSCEIIYGTHGGCIKRLKYYDENGNLNCYGRGYAIKEYSKIDSVGRIVEMCFYNEKSDPCLCREGYAKCKCQYSQDANGKHKIASFFGVEDQPVMAKVVDNPLTIAHMIVETQSSVAGGYRKRISLLNTDWTHMVFPSLECYEVELAVDENGALVECYGIDGVTKMNAMGVGIATCECKYVRRFGKKVGIRMLTKDANGNSVVNPKIGNDEMYLSLNDDGRICSVEYRVGGKLKNNALGFAKTLLEYDAFGRIVRAWNVAEDDVTVVPDAYGAPVHRYVYRNNRVCRVEFCTLGGELVDGIEGHAVELIEYDNYGRSVREVYLDKNNNRANWKSTGFAEAVHSYASDGREVEYYYLDSDRCPVADKKTGAFVVKKVYNAHPNTAVIAFFEADGQTPMTSPIKGYHAGKQIYNDLGMIIQQEFYDKNLDLVEESSGIAVRKVELDRFGRENKWVEMDRHLGVVSEMLRAQNNECGYPCWYVSAPMHDLLVGDIIVAIDDEIFAGRISGFDINTHTGNCSRVTVARVVDGDFGEKISFRDCNLDLHDTSCGVFGVTLLGQGIFGKIKTSYYEWKRKPLIMR